MMQAKVTGTLHYDGIWESAVKSAEKHLVSATQDQVISVENLRASGGRSEFATSHLPRHQ